MIKCLKCIQQSHQLQCVSSFQGFFPPQLEIGCAIYVMIRLKLVQLITINYDLCSLTVLFSLALENNQRGITQPSGLQNLCTMPFSTDAWKGTNSGYMHKTVLQWALFVGIDSCTVLNVIVMLHLFTSRWEIIALSHGYTGGWVWAAHCWAEGHLQ